MLVIISSEYIQHYQDKIGCDNLTVETANHFGEAQINGVNNEELQLIAQHFNFVGDNHFIKITGIK